MLNCIASFKLLMFEGTMIFGKVKSDKIEVICIDILKITNSYTCGVGRDICWNDGVGQSDLRRLSWYIETGWDLKREENCFVSERWVKSVSLFRLTFNMTARTKSYLWKAVLILPSIAMHFENTYIRVHCSCIKKNGNFNIFKLPFALLDLKNFILFTTLSMFLPCSLAIQNFIFPNPLVASCLKVSI